MIKMIWAQSANGWIGKDGKLPWKVPAEMAHFRKLTMNSQVVMGRKTHDSIPSYALPGRRIILVTSQNVVYRDPFGFQVDDPSVLLSFAGDKDRHIWIAGGRQIYDFFMPYADELHVSEINLNVDGDVRAPEVNLDDWHVRDVAFYPEFTYERLIRI